MTDVSKKHLQITLPYFRVLLSIYHPLLIHYCYYYGTVTIATTACSFIQQTHSVE